MARRRAGGGRHRRRRVSAPRSSRCASVGARSSPGRTSRRDGLGHGTVGLVDPQQTAGPLDRARCRSGASSPTTPRNAAALHVELDVDGTAVDLVGVHLTSRLPYGPPIQLRRLAPQLPTPGRPAVVAGDCNFWGPGVRTLLPGWRRAVRGRTWPASRPHSQIDHILVRPADRRRADARCSATSAPTTAPCAPTLDHRVDTHAMPTDRAGVVSLAKGAPVEIRDVVVPEPGPGEARVTRAGVRCVPHRPALPRGRDQRRLPVPARARGGGRRRVGRARRRATSRPATS